MPGKLVHGNYNVTTRLIRLTQLVEIFLFIPAVKQQLLTQLLGSNEVRRFFVYFLELLRLPPNLGFLIEAVTHLMPFDQLLD